MNDKIEVDKVKYTFGVDLVVDEDEERTKADLKKEDPKDDKVIDEHSIAYLGYDPTGNFS